MRPDTSIKALLIALTDDSAPAVFSINRLKPELLCFFVPESGKSLVERQVQPQIAQEYAPYSALPSMIWRAPVFPHTWDMQAVVPFTLEEKRPLDRASKPN